MNDFNYRIIEPCSIVGTDAPSLARHLFEANIKYSMSFYPYRNKTVWHTVYDAALSYEDLVMIKLIFNDVKVVEYGTNLDSIELIE